MPADAKATYEPSATTQVFDAKTSATTVGIVDWKTIAPVMLPIASVSLPWRTQMTELNFSGSSVAIGAMTRARSAGSTPSVVARCSTASTKKTAPTMISPRAARTCRLTTRRRGAARVVAMGAARSRRRKRSGARSVGVDVRVGLEVALDVPGVDPDQDDRHDPLQPDRLERQERRADGDRVGDREVAHVVGEDARVDAHDVAGRALAGRPQDGDAGHEHGQRREHERRAQDGPDADRVRRLAGREQDGDDRDHRLGQGRADRGQDRADRALGQLELAPEPFDAVGEQLGAEQDDDEARRPG